ncbi:hypothetical protein DdX_13958 [Ditylenchus destructor]|uniref:Regulatory protein zeste n=1 Tax=Ditylenchus destructor TaxID=166010 RepID=A0AAD4R2A5_9BILA|nr:hypothetical protein DdX_13958 [Ditylenchus destructor]
MLANNIATLDKFVDRNIVKFDLAASALRVAKPLVKIRKFSDAQFSKLNFDLLHNDWSHHLDACFSIQTKYEAFATQLKALFDHHCPEKTIHATSKCRNSTCPDSIPFILLKNCSSTLAPILTELFRIILDEGNIPQAWRRTNLHFSDYFSFSAIARHYPMLRTEGQLYIYRAVFVTGSLVDQRVMSLIIETQLQDQALYASSQQSHRLSASLPPLSSAHAAWPPLSSAHAALPSLSSALAACLAHAYLYPKKAFGPGKNLGACTAALRAPPSQRKTLKNGWESGVLDAELYCLPVGAPEASLTVLDPSPRHLQWSHRLQNPIEIGNESSCCWFSRSEPLSDMTSIMNSTEKKEILIQIKENWAEINADFDKKGMNRYSRENAWKAIYEECKSRGHKWTAENDWKWISGTKWPAWKNEFNKKLLRQKKTGSGGETRFNEFDLLIQEIIGKDSPDIQTLGVPESLSGESAENDFLAKKQVTTTPSTSSQSCILEQTPRGTKRAKSEFSGTSSKDSMELKRSRLLDLEIESRLLDIQLKKRQIYKSDLEIHSMECELQIPNKFLHITPHCETDTNVTIVNDDFNSEEMFHVEV